MMRLLRTQSGARNDRERKKIRKEIQRMDSRFHGNDISDELREMLQKVQDDNKKRVHGEFYIFFQFYNVL